MPPATKRRLQTSIVEEEQKRQQQIMQMHNGMMNTNAQMGNNAATSQANNMALQYHDELSTMGMRIRQSVDQGYQMPSNYTTMNNNSHSQASTASNNTGFNNSPIQDNSTYTIPEYKRVPMHNFMGNPQQMLINQGINGSSSSSTRSASSLEMWESRVQERLCNIGEDGANAEIIENVLKRGYDDSF